MYTNTYIHTFITHIFMYATSIHMPKCISHNTYMDARTDMYHTCIKAVVQEWWKKGLKTERQQYKALVMYIMTINIVHMLCD